MKKYKLMIKIHKKTGLKYLCITHRENFEVYSGSGVYWKNHLKKYGNDFTTEVLFDTDSLEELKSKGLEISSLYDVVESNEWANLIPESGYHIYSDDRAFHYGWFGWYNTLSESDKIKRNKNISKKVTERLSNITPNVLSEILSNRRKNLSEEAKDRRKRKIQEVYKSGKHNKLFERYSKERTGKGNPASKSIEVNGVLYGSIQEASRKTGIPAHKLYRKKDGRIYDC